jgi:hypothetical protein
VDTFSRAARWIFLRGLMVYGGAVVVLAAGAGAAFVLEGSRAPVGILVAEVALGALYYVDLTLTSLGRVDVVLRAWLVGGFAGSALMLGLDRLRIDTATAAWWGTHVAVWLALLLLLIAAPRIVAAPCSH